MQARVLYRDVLDVFCTYCSVWKASLYYNFFTWPDFQHFLQQSLQWCRPCLAGHRVEPSISWIISYVTCEALNETWTPHQVFCVCFVRCELTLVTFPVMFSTCDSPPPPFFFLAGVILVTGNQGWRGKGGLRRLYLIRNCRSVKEGEHELIPGRKGFIKAADLRSLLTFKFFLHVIIFVTSLWWLEFNVNTPLWSHSTFPLTFSVKLSH